MKIFGVKAAGVLAAALWAIPVCAAVTPPASDQGGAEARDLRLPPRVVIELPQRTLVTPMPSSTARLARADNSDGDLVGQVAAAYNIDPILLAAVVQVESGRRADAQSSEGALGLMQVMPATGRLFGADPAALLQPAPNLAVGSAYLKRLQGRFDNDLSAVLAAYNAGEGAVARYGDALPFAETRAYVDRVLTAYQSARRLAGFDDDQ